LPADRAPAIRAPRSIPFSIQALTHRLPVTPDGIAFFASPAFRGFFIGTPPLHLAKSAFALHFLLQNAKRCVDVIVSNEYLCDGATPSFKWVDSSIPHWPGDRLTDLIERQALPDLLLIS